MMVFEERGNRCRVENQQTQPTYDAESGNRTWLHWWEASALTTAPSLHPQIKWTGELMLQKF